MPGNTPTLRFTFAGAIAALLVVHVLAYSPSQLLWGCHVASIAIAIGLALERPWMIAVGVLFHAGEGVPAFVIDTIAGHGSISSTLVHTAPIAAGVWALWGRPLPRRILVPAWAIHPLALGAAYLFADPALNVMLSRAPYEGTASLFPALWISWLANAALAFAGLAIAYVAFVRGWARWA